MTSAITSRADEIAEAARRYIAARKEPRMGATSTEETSAAWDALCRLCAEPVAASEGRTPLPQTSYEPLTKDEIQSYRERTLRGGGLLPQGPDAFHRLCDMALSSLLYGEEIHRLRSLPSATAPADVVDAARYRWLRDNTFVEGYWLDGAGGVDTKIRVQGSVHFLDAAIDAAGAIDRKTP